MFVRNPYNYDTKLESMRTGVISEGKSKTVQSQKDEADINTIVRRHGLTGEMPAVVKIPQYGDFTGVKDYQTALNSVKAAEKSFMEIPADIRQMFGNDPQKFLEFCADPKNEDKLVELGLAKKKKVEPAPPAPTEPVVTPAVAVAPPTK